MIILVVDSQIYTAESITIKGGRMILECKNRPARLLRPLGEVLIEGVPNKLNSDGTVQITIVPRKDMTWIG